MSSDSTARDHRLLWTLEQGLGDAYTEEVNRAWTAVYTLLAKVMIDATEQSVPSEANQ